MSTNSFSYWDTASARWVTPSGNLRVYLGTSALLSPANTTVRIG